MFVLRTVLLALFSFVGSVFLTLFLILLVGGAFTAARETRVPVAFSDFLADVDAGKVTEIHVSGRSATFLVARDGRQEERRTVGPFDERDAVLALRPKESDLPAPKITFAK